MRITACDVYAHATLAGRQAEKSQNSLQMLGRAMIRLYGHKAGSAGARTMLRADRRRPSSLEQAAAVCGAGGQLALVDCLLAGVQILARIFKRAFRHLVAAHEGCHRQIALEQALAQHPLRALPRRIILGQEHRG